MTEYQALCCSALFDEGGSRAYPYILKYSYPWQALDHVGEIIDELIKGINVQEYYSPEGGIWISRSAKIAKSALICAPAIIMDGAEIRHSAFLRGNTVIGRGAVIGNSCEIKNSIVFDKAEIPHFNYVGDSIIGYRAHLGAGAVTSNVKSDRTPVGIRFGDERIETKRRKLGAMVGDFAEVGCGAVLNPGTVIGRHTTVYPLSSTRGFIPESVIYKSKSDIVKKE